MLKDLSIEGSRVARHTPRHWLNGKQGELVLVNGQHRPRITAPGGVARLRVINACNARIFVLGLEGHQMTLLGAGIGFAEQAARVESLRLAPGERADLLVTLGRTGEVALAALPYDRGADMGDMAAMPAGGQGHGGHDTQDREAMGGGRAAAHHGAQRRLGNTEVIVLATVAAAKLSPPPRLPDRLAVLPSYDPRAARRRRIVMSEEMGAGPVRFLLNGRSYEPGRIDFACELGSAEIWELVNEADMDHPFHVHIDPFIVLSRNGRPEPVRMWRDTVDLSPGDRVEIIIPFRDFAGNVLYHRHFAEHEDRGMMGLFEVTLKHRAFPHRHRKRRATLPQPELRQAPRTIGDLLIRSSGRRSGQHGDPRVRLGRGPRRPRWVPGRTSTSPARGRRCGTPPRRRRRGL